LFSPNDGAEGGLPYALRGAREQDGVVHAFLGLLNEVAQEVENVINCGLVGIEQVLQVLKKGLRFSI
jgi:hypothetical protein